MPRKKKPAKKYDRPGQPTKYTPEMADNLREYFTVEPYTIVDGKKEACDFPTLAGFFAKYMISNATIYNWTNSHEEFFNAMEYAKKQQEYILSTNTLHGLYHAGFAAFMAKNLIGWRDKHEIETKSINVEVKIDADMSADKALIEYQKITGRLEDGS